VAYVSFTEKFGPQFGGEVGAFLATSNILEFTLGEAKPCR
jgi:hypothetical protein